MSDPLEAYDAACADYAANWRALDEDLYGLCRRLPGHADPAHVNAKLWIIGRTFATGIERRVPSDGKQGGSLHTVASLLRENHEDVDGIFDRVRAIAEPLTPEKLKIVLAEHGRFNSLLRGVTHKHQSARSFASKYMHFHCPAVPIYDSLAAARLRKLLHWHGSLNVIGPVEKADDWYRWHCLRFWRLYQDLRQAGKDVTVRLVDVFLLW